MSNSSYPKVSILGVDIDAVTMNQAAADIVDYALSDKPAAYVTKPYVEFLDRAASAPDIQKLLNDGLLTLPDSVALQWAALYLAGPKRSLGRLFSTLSQILFAPAKLSHIIPERFAGVDFCWIMLEEAVRQNASIYLVGGPENSTIEKTAIAIQTRLPHINILGTFDGYEANTKEAELTEELLKLKPKLILVGMGFPRQEKLMARLTEKLPYGVLVGEGGTFDYQSFGGILRRAPQWMRHLGLEWLWRLLLQPQRFKRQLAIPRFIWKVYKSS